MTVPEQVDRGYVRRRAGQEWFFRNKPLGIPALIESIQEDFQVKISVQEAKELFSKYLSETTCLDRDTLEKEFVSAMRELALENPNFAQRLEILSVEQLRDNELENGLTGGLKAE